MMFFVLFRFRQFATRNADQTMMRSRRTRSAAPVVICVALAASLIQSDAWLTTFPGQSTATCYNSRLFLTRSSNGDEKASPRSRSRNSNPPRRRSSSRPRRRKPLLNMAPSSSTAVDETMKQKERLRRKPKDALPTQHLELLDHEILTLEEEMELGTRVNRASKLRDAISILVDDKKAERQEEILKEVYHADGYNVGVDGQSMLSDEALIMSNENLVVDLEDLRHLSIHSSASINKAKEDALFDPDGTPVLSGQELSLDNHFQNQLERGITGIRELDHRLLTDDDIVYGLEVKGGRDEMRQILLEGAFARDRLIRNNIRLVVRIAKRWARQSVKYDTASIVTVYGGSSSRPSLDEAIQEGILGLARAADRYDPSRGLRFSTYSTHWVTSFVRNCFQDASTGSLRVPAQLYTIKNRYKTLLKRYYDSKTDIPSEESIAEELGVSVKRLRTALKATQQLMSIDGPVAIGPRKGSGAGTDSMGAGELLISDTLQCTEACPEGYVELSFLRQCLENAMASELSPHERDVLRLRLGLDDGVTRTAREVVDVCGGSVSLSEVRLAEQRAYKKLRAPYSLHNYQLLAYLDFAGIEQSTL